MNSSAKNFYPITDESDGFFDIMLITGEPIITDYSSMTNDIVISADNTLSLGKTKKKIKVETISDLQKVLVKLTMHVEETIMNSDVNVRAADNVDCDLDIIRDDATNEFDTYYYSRFFERIVIDSNFIYQLMFDILYDKYRLESECLTLNKYCETCIDFNWDNSIYIKAIEELMKEYPFSSILKKNAVKLGSTSNSYINCIKRDLEKAKYVREKINGQNKSELQKTLIGDVRKLFQEKKENEKALKQSFWGEKKEQPRTIDIDECCKNYLECLITSLIDAKNKSIQAMRVEISEEANIMNNPQQREDVEKFDIDPDKNIEYWATLNDYFGTSKKKPKFIWDAIYYNSKNTNHSGKKLITSRQYDRNFGIDRKNHNYYFTEFVDDFTYYDKYVENTFNPNEEDYKDYFWKSMSFYNLEIYKRLDFIYKLAVKMEDVGFADIDRNHFSVKRFYPDVICPYVYENQLYFTYKRKYYRPMLFIEEILQERYMRNFELLKKEFSDRYDKEIALNISYRYNLLRAKVYEIFNYKYNFASDNYEDISKFIREHYNVLSYHEKNKEWYNKDRKSREQTLRIQNAEKINDALFWKSQKREPVEWENPSVKRKKH